MMRERKDRSVDWPLIYRFGLQSRQDPHAAPASGGLFEQNLALTNYKCVLFDEPLCVQSGFPDRDYFRIFRAAESFYRANAAFRLSGKADKRAKIDECRVVNAGVGFWNERAAYCQSVSRPELESIDSRKSKRRVKTRTV